MADETDHTPAPEASRTPPFQFWTAVGRRKVEMAVVTVVAATVACVVLADRDFIAIPLAERKARAAGSWESVHAAVDRLEERGDAAVPALLRLARCRTEVPHRGEENWQAPIPPDMVPRDAVADVALDALRCMRTGSTGRAFEWHAESGKSFQEAWEAYRRSELAEAEAWWRARQAGEGRKGYDKKGNRR